MAAAAALKAAAAGVALPWASLSVLRGVALSRGAVLQELAQVHEEVLELARFVALAERTSVSRLVRDGLELELARGWSAPWGSWEAQTTKRTPST
jgi:hypothetical protein